LIAHLARSRRTAPRIAIAVSLLLSVLTVSAARGASLPYSVHEVYVPSFDGTLLHVSVFRPAGAGTSRTPAILSFTPYDNTGGSIGGAAPFFTPTATSTPVPDGSLAAAGMFGAGFTYVQVALRGTGGSGGCWDLWGPDTQRDTKVAIEWAAAQPWSDGRVVTYGFSAGAFSELDAIAMRPKGLVAAVLVQASIGSGEVWTNNVRNAVEGTAWGPAWLVNTMFPPSLSSSLAYDEDAIGRHVVRPGCEVLAALGPEAAPDSAYWRARDWVGPAVTAAINGQHLPVLWVGGFHDWNARETVFINLFSTIAADVPHRAYFGQWWHGPRRAPEGLTMAALGMQWFEHFVDGTPLPDAPAVAIQSIDGTWRGESSWPPSDERSLAIALTPGSYQATLGNNEETISPEGGPAVLPTGKGIWTVTGPLAQPLHLSGNPSMRASVDSLAPLGEVIALVYDIDPAGNATFVDRGAIQVGAGTSQVTMALAPGDWDFAAGHRIGVLLTGDDDFWFEPRGEAPITLRSATVTLPILRCGAPRVLSSGVPNFLPRPLPPAFHPSVPASTRPLVVPC
jgi:predicted acyl esterase